MAQQQDRTSLYAEITSKIIADLEKGRVPWVQPWGNRGSASPLDLPSNAVTRRRYSGINVLILWGAVIEGEFASQNWLTFRQAKELGAQVRRGERPVRRQRLPTTYLPFRTSRMSTQGRGAPNRFNTVLQSALRNSREEERGWFFRDGLKAEREVSAGPSRRPKP